MTIRAVYGQKQFMYRKFTSNRLSLLVLHPSIFRLFMKGKFDTYLLWSFTQRVQNWIVDWSTARDFTVLPFKVAKKIHQNVQTNDTIQTYSQLFDKWIHSHLIFSRCTKYSDLCVKWKKFIELHFFLSPSISADTFDRIEWYFSKEI